jgi:hypothetical protein
VHYRQMCPFLLCGEVWCDCDSYPSRVLYHARLHTRKASYPDSETSKALAVYSPGVNYNGFGLCFPLPNNVRSTYATHSNYSAIQLVA